MSLAFLLNEIPVVSVAPQFIVMAQSIKTAQCRGTTQNLF